MRDFNGIVVFFLIMCPRSFTRVKKIVICLGLLTCFHFLIFDGAVQEL